MHVLYVASLVKGNIIKWFASFHFGGVVEYFKIPIRKKISQMISNYDICDIMNLKMEETNINIGSFLPVP
jgi:hypothetical protein